MRSIFVRVEPTVRLVTDAVIGASRIALTLLVEPGLGCCSVRHSLGLMTHCFNVVAFWVDNESAVVMSVIVGA